MSPTPNDGKNTRHEEITLPSLTDPMEGLESFQPAFRAKQLHVVKGDLDASIWVHFDEPADGVHRYSYAKTRGDKVIGLVMVVQVEAIDGLPCFGVGYAVPEDERRKGIAKALLASSIAEFRNGVARNGLKDLWFEAVIGVENVASQRVAEAVLDVVPSTGEDNISGEPVLVFARRYGLG